MKIGNTPLKRLETAEKYAHVYTKLECENAGGSIKDRVAFAILDDAEKRGVLKKGGLVVEATSGNTGIGLALACKERGYRAVIVMPDSMSVERRRLIASYGAEVLLTDGKKGMQGAVEKAKELVESEPNSLLADQFNNPVCAQAHYDSTGVEIWEQTGGKVDIFVACVGTGGTLTGVGRYLKEKNPKIKVVAVEPANSPLLSKGYAGSHSIQGIGANFIPSVLDRNIYDEVLTVTDEEAISTAKALKEREGVWVGISSGAAYVAAKRLSERIENEGKTVVTVFPDHGNRYTL
ncbi:MAG: cysteine synthase A [Clostridia bacterium]|nr:cysteine synthase A [Clostridia bacterium]